MNLGQFFKSMGNIMTIIKTIVIINYYHVIVEKNVDKLSIETLDELIKALQKSKGIVIIIIIIIIIIIFIIK